MRRPGLSTQRLRGYSVAKILLSPGSLMTRFIVYFASLTSLNVVDAQALKLALKVELKLNQYFQKQIGSASGRSGGDNVGISRHHGPALCLPSPATARLQLFTGMTTFRDLGATRMISISRLLLLLYLHVAPTILASPMAGPLGFGSCKPSRHFC